MGLGCSILFTLWVPKRFVFTASCIENLAHVWKTPFANEIPVFLSNRELK